MRGSAGGACAARAGPFIAARSASASLQRAALKSSGCGPAF
jgi:hypothetical protein